MIGRPVPRSDREEALVQRAYREIGPVARKAAESSFQAIGRQLGPGRPLQIYIDALRRGVVSIPQKSSKARQRKRRRHR